jgi:hypothetical protein
MCIMAHRMLELRIVRCLCRTSAVNNPATSQLAPISAHDPTASMFRAQTNYTNLNHVVDMSSFKRTIIRKLFCFQMMKLTINLKTSTLVVRLTHASNVASSSQNLFPIKLQDYQSHLFIVLM